MNSYRAARVLSIAAASGLALAFSAGPALAQAGGVPCAALGKAVIGNTGQVLLNANSLVDSYQSSLGPYGGANVGNAGNVQAATQIIVNSGGVINGTRTPNTPAGLAVVPPPAGAINLGNLNLGSGQTRTLAAGDYVASNVSLNSNSTLAVTGGRVRIWVTGSLAIGGTVNNNGLPANFEFLVTSANDINVNGGASLFGVIYAPAAGVNVSGPVFGAVIGSHVTLNSGGRVHFDQDLGAVGCVAQITAGQFHTCARTSGSAELCWGLNLDGQIGDGTTTTRLAPVAVKGLGPVSQIGNGFDNSCAVSGTGVFCWGSNAFGENGTGMVTNGANPTPGAVQGLTSAARIVAGSSSSTYAITAGGAVSAWGNNQEGELGDGTTTLRPFAAPVSGLAAPVVAMSGGTVYACAVLSTGAVQCWGTNVGGNLGDGTTTDRSTPVTAVGVSGAVGVATGRIHTCAVLSNGGVQCWGINGSGQLGDGTTTDRLTAVPVVGLGGPAVAVTAAGDYTCALLASGSLQCWGDNTFGQFGNGTTTGSLTPVAAATGITTAIGITSGGDLQSQHTCAVTTAGNAFCWGSNESGELGNGTTTPSTTPVAVTF
jgi:alpha-tubulin suppressor-like RCC1 family protein